METGIFILFWFDFLYDFCVPVQHMSQFGIFSFSRFRKHRCRDQSIASNFSASSSVSRSEVLFETCQAVQLSDIGLALDRKTGLLMELGKSG